MSRLLATILILLPSLSYAQLTVSSGTSLRIGDGTVVTTDGNVVNESESVQFGPQSGLLLSGAEDQLLRTTPPLTIPTLSITGGSNKSIEGAVLISGTLDLANGKIVIGGSIEQNSLVILNGVSINENADSWVVGSLIQEGQGAKLFPLGANGQYAPVLLNIAGSDNTLTAVAASTDNGGLNLELPNNIVAVSSAWNWQVSGSGISEIGVTLPIQTEDEALITGDDLIYTVLETSTSQSQSVSLGGIQGTITGGIPSVSAEQSSLNPNSAQEFDRVFLLGAERTTVPVIHNIITPNNDNSNDFLFIEAISVYGDDNEVILLDRWGTEVYRQENFRNFNDTDNPYDGSFDFLDPGNYICIVTYAGQTAKQTITVLD